MRTLWITLPLLSAPGWHPPLRAQNAPSAAVQCTPDNGGLSLPDSLCAVVVGRDLGPVRHLVVAPSGDVFVNVAKGPSASRHRTSCCPPRPARA